MSPTPARVTPPPLRPAWCGRTLFADCPAALAAFDAVRDAASAGRLPAAQLFATPADALDFIDALLAAAHARGDDEGAGIALHALVMHEYARGAFEAGLAKRRA